MEWYRFPRITPMDKCLRGLLVALNAGVMPRFERVVALPDPKS